MVNEFWNVLSSTASLTGSLDCIAKILFRSLGFDSDSGASQYNWVLMNPRKLGYTRNISGEVQTRTFITHQDSTKFGSRKVYDSTALRALRGGSCAPMGVMRISETSGTLGTSAPEVSHRWLPLTLSALLSPAPH
ncbi:hypothetical protein B0H16DRAFT_1469260 [Mycena metata]|uniref:Uncharacterized protein n=1 Tax=Mycena metata TaxID=1033252 RepID=A0AAD7HYW7_9AGAR|nr:hypothetical protein B0H16DRAFT_1469260 [Mycena metata]